MTPSLLAPRGAVDAVGSNLVSRIGSLNLRVSGGAAGRRGEAHGGTGRSGSGAQSQGQMSVRDV